MTRQSFQNFLQRPSLVACRRRLFDFLDWVLVAIIRTVLLRLTTAHRNPQVKRSLWTGSPIITLALKSRAERLLGVHADSLVFSTYFVTHQFDYVLSRWMRIPILRIFLPYAVLFWACLKYQRFHVFYDRGILTPIHGLRFPERELQLLRRLNKEVYVWAYGADVRTRRLTEQLGPFNCCTECPRPGQACICDDEAGRENYATVKRYASAVFSMGDMIEYTPGSRNDLFFWPIDLDRDNGQRYSPKYPDPHSDRPVRIVHAPNHRQFKGTRFLLAAVKNLQGEGLNIELQLVERVPNLEALEIYRSADIIFDQCLIGFHGYFANEAMAMGKPVMAYIRRPDEYLLRPDECPLISADASQLETTLRSLVQDRQRMYDLGVSGRKYIENHYTLEAFARRLGVAYEEINRHGSHERKAA